MITRAFQGGGYGQFVDEFVTGHCQRDLVPETEIQTERLAGRTFELGMRW